MRNLFILLFFVFFVLTNAYAYEVTSIEFSDIAIEHPETQTVELGAVTDRFPVETPIIHALVHLKGVGRNDSVLIRWVRNDALPKPNTTLAEIELKLAPYTKLFHIYYNNSDFQLPKGRYSLELYSNSKLLAKKSFVLYSPEHEKADRKPLYKIPGISEIYLARDVKTHDDGSVTPIGVSDHFPNSQHNIYVVIPYKNLKAGIPYSIEWIIVDDGINRNKILYKKEGIIRHAGKIPEGTIVANIHLPRDWPNGIFEVVFRLDGKPLLRKQYTIGDVSKLAKAGAQSEVESVDKHFQKQLITRLANWMLASIEKRDLKPLYEHSVHSWRDSTDWIALKRGFQGIFNAPLKWEEIFAQTPKLLPLKRLANGAIRLQAIYPGINSVDVLLEGTFYKEGGEWRLLGFALEPVNP
ncbi:hypothetical protein [Thermodesulfatator autotrophicus]|uniref:Uncharacterized protein n=1 Tax=Thermodesulfatator autotrophicus TaxID=1795632 RepID=A0A177E5N9_9BACT|nr:hypothetical protein [Thermodesulfatator autotrophicus]OAG27283.1 hypothetical protein TH606_07700 [Thermodesulfatator autotrophicus]